ncbi:hypothetical protein SLOPH_976 [Spraguea lophii 42_110]|uniref:6-bladed beta-propeller n=1 Tax=Spraguea lophii (strain 42_110) TaxID=1358809 RepID=S7W7R7_SPRLO|nr:hypothetical protein SLOPH_976 [Spraguea lophii 42_110]
MPMDFKLFLYCFLGLIRSSDDLTTEMDPVEFLQDNTNCCGFAILNTLLPRVLNSKNDVIQDCKVFFNNGNVSFTTPKNYENETLRLSNRGLILAIYTRNNDDCYLYDFKRPYVEEKEVEYEGDDGSISELSFPNNGKQLFVSYDTYKITFYDMKNNILEGVTINLKDNKFFLQDKNENIITEGYYTYRYNQLIHNIRDDVYMPTSYLILRDSSNIDICISDLRNYTHRLKDYPFVEIKWKYINRLLRYNDISENHTNVQQCIQQNPQVCKDTKKLDSSFQTNPSTPHSILKNRDNYKKEEYTLDYEFPAEPTFINLNRSIENLLEHTPINTLSEEIKNVLFTTYSRTLTNDFAFCIKNMMQNKNDEEKKQIISIFNTFLDVIRKGFYDHVGEFKEKVKELLEKENNYGSDKLSNKKAFDDMKKKKKNTLPDYDFRKEEKEYRENGISNISFLLGISFCVIIHAII